MLGAGVTTLNTAKVHATITDFSVADDSIRLDAATFAGLAPGALPAGALLIVGSEGSALGGGLGAAPPSSAPADLTARLIYDAATGSLAWDADGSGSIAAIVLATLTPGLALTTDDFVVA